MLNALPFFLQALLFLISSLLITYLLIPKIVWVAREKELVVKPDHRSSHHLITPSFGGVAFFIVFILCYSFLKSMYIGMNSTFIIPAVTILFVVGLKDDLVISSAWAKLGGQFIAVTLLLFGTGFYKLDFHGFLGVHELPVYISIPFIYFFMIGFVNAYNLIDGIDGLAAFLGIVMFGAMAFLFHQAGDLFYVLFSVVGMGMLLAFVRFNFSKSLKRKIFMGDTGSLVIGFLLAFLALKSLALDCGAMGLHCHNLPALMLIILAIPIFDTLRIMVVRKLAGNGIFQPDRNHVHHILIDLGLTHFRTSLLLSLVSISLNLVAYQLSFHFDWPVLLGFIVFHALLASFIFHRLKQRVSPMRIKGKNAKGKMAWARIF